MDRTQVRMGSLLLGVAVQAACAWPDPTGQWQPPADVVDDGVLVVEPVDPVVDPAPACPGVQGIAYEQPRPNVMLLVDRSGSMSAPGTCSEGACPSKWNQLLALGGYLEDVKAHATLGLTVFPDLEGDACGASAGTLVPLSDAADVDSQILAAVSRTAPGGRTPIAAALDALGRSGTLDDPDRENIIVLLTDGQPNCTCANEEVACEEASAVAAVSRLASRDVPIKVDVVGFGSSATAASQTLSAMATAAGTALPGPVAYFEAETVEQLIGYLYQIAAGLAPCRFQLDELPEPENLVVHLDDAEVPVCTTTPCTAGYVYDRPRGEVELQGDSCQAIRDGACHSVWFESR